MNTFLFDLDGTLTDPREGITRCDLLAHLLPLHGVRGDKAVMIGDRDVDMRAACVAADAGVSPRRPLTATRCRAPRARAPREGRYA